MVAGRVHLRLGQGRDAILGPRPSLLETSILPRPPWGIFHPSNDAGAGARGPLPSPHPRPVIHAAVLRSQSLHSAMTLGVQGPAAGLFFRFCMLLATTPLSTAFFFARPSPCHSMSRARSIAQ